MYHHPSKRKGGRREKGEGRRERREKGEGREGRRERWERRERRERREILLVERWKEENEASCTCWFFFLFFVLLFVARGQMLLF